MQQLDSYRSDKALPSAGCNVPKEDIRLKSKLKRWLKLQEEEYRGENRNYDSKLVIGILNFFTELSSRGKLEILSSISN